MIRPTKKTAPFDKSSSYSVVCDRFVGSPIVCLLYSVDPAAVLRRVVSVRVNAIKCASRRALAHVIKKCKKVVTPSFVHLNAAAAVYCKAVCFFVVAAFNHAAPTLKCRSFPVVAGGLFGSFPCKVSDKTTARLGVSTIQCPNTNKCGISAVTAAFPYGLVVFGMRKLNRSQLSKAFLRDVFSSFLASTALTTSARNCAASFQAFLSCHSCCSTIADSVPTSSSAFVWRP